MPVPDYETLMLPLLRRFGDGARNVSECLPALAEQFEVTEEEAAELIPSGRVTVLSNRAHWARTYLSKAGLLESPKRNLHVITERGNAALAEGPERIDNSWLQRFDGFNDWKNASRGTVSDTGSQGELSPEGGQASPEEALNAAYATIHSVLVSELREELYRIDPKRFERLIEELLFEMGYGGGVNGSIQAAKGGADGGVDGVIFEDALGLDAVYMQAKRYAAANIVGRPDIQQFIGSMTGEGAMKGVFVTTSDFTRDAQDYASRVPQRLVLINGAQLAELMIAHEVGVRARRTLVLRSIDEDAFAADG